MEQERLQDIEVILSHRYDLGADLWSTPDKKLMKGAPFTTLECISYLLTLGMSREDDVLKEAAALLFQAWREDGRFKVSPSGGIYPCHSAAVVNTLCQMGYAQDERCQRTFQHFLQTQEADGGWKCNKYSFGHGEETAYSTPFTTLTILNAFRYSPTYQKAVVLDQAASFLLQHWTIKKVISPCHYGIGTLFMQLEYPFRGYNLFYYVYVLSFYKCCRQDSRFLEALHALEAKVDHGEIVVERVVPKLSTLHFCKKGQPSPYATQRYREILQNLTT